MFFVFPRFFRSGELRNENFPNFSNFRPEFSPGFCSEFSPNFLRTFRASFCGRRRPEKIYQKSPPFFNAKSPGKHEKTIHKILLESRQSNGFWGGGRGQISFEQGFGACQSLAQKIKVPFSKIFSVFLQFSRIRGRFQKFTHETPVETLSQGGLSFLPFDVCFLVFFCFCLSSVGLFLVVSTCVFPSLRVQTAQTIICTKSGVSADSSKGA